MDCLRSRCRRISQLSPSFISTGERRCLPGVSEDREPEETRKKRKESGRADVWRKPRGCASIAADAARPKKSYRFPPLSLLKKGSRHTGDSDAHLRETAMKLQQTLENFGVKVTVTDVSCGPSVTRYMNCSRRWESRSARLWGCGRYQAKSGGGGYPDRGADSGQGRGGHRGAE